MSQDSRALMAFCDYDIQKEDDKRLVVNGTSLASIESLSMPLVQEIVVSADIRCSECQKRIADIMSRMSEIECVVVNVLEKKVVITCTRYTYTNVVATKMALLRRFFKSPWT